MTAFKGLTSSTPADVLSNAQPSSVQPSTSRDPLTTASNQWKLGKCNCVFYFRPQTFYWLF